MTSIARNPGVEDDDDRHWAQNSRKKFIPSATAQGQNEPFVAPTENDCGA